MPASKFVVEDAIAKFFAEHNVKTIRRRDLYRMSGSQRVGLMLFHRALLRLRREDVIDIEPAKDGSGNKNDIIRWRGRE